MSTSLKVLFIGVQTCCVWAQCHAQELSPTDLPDSLAVGSRSFLFLVDTDTLYQKLEVYRSDAKSIHFDLAVVVKDATWQEDTLRSDGVLFWSGSYGPVVVDSLGTTQWLLDEWCFSGKQIEICLRNHAVRQATIRYLAPTAERMDRR